MPSYKAFLKQPAKPVPELSSPGVQAHAQEVTEFTFEAPEVWTGPDVTHTLNTLAKMVGRLQGGQSFKFDSQQDEKGIALALYLTPDKKGAFIHTEPLPIPGPLFLEWKQQNVTPGDLGRRH